jgi:hypothetical protein
MKIATRIAALFALLGSSAAYAATGEQVHAACCALGVCCGLGCC